MIRINFPNKAKSHKVATVPVRPKLISKLTSDLHLRYTIVFKVDLIIPVF